MSQPPSPPLAIVADDLTGACDAGVHFLGTGWRVEVVLDPDRPLTGADLHVIATNTRSLPHAEAGRIVAQLAERLRAGRRGILYKKLDSTLHGNFGAEINALLQAGFARVALVCPAFPDMGRRLLRGDLLMGAERTPIGRNLAALLTQQSGRAVDTIPVEELRAGLPSLLSRVQAAQERGLGILAFDAEEERDLERVVELGRILAPDALLCGSTGMARHLGRSLAAATGPEMRPCPPGPGPGPALRRLGILGTRSGVTREQVECLAREREARPRSLEDAIEDLARHSPAPGHCPLPTQSGMPNEPASLREPLIAQLDLADLPPERLDAALQGLRDHGPVFLMLSGGDTARRVCEAAGVRAIELRGEIETGFPHGRLVGGGLDGWPVATKAGGFGDSRSLVRWADF